MVGQVVMVMVMVHVLTATFEMAIVSVMAQSSIVGAQVVMVIVTSTM